MTGGTGEGNTGLAGVTPQGHAPVDGGMGGGMAWRGKGRGDHGGGVLNTVKPDFFICRITLHELKFFRPIIRKIKTKKNH